MTGLPRTPVVQHPTVVPEVKQQVANGCITCAGTGLCPDCNGTGGADDVEPCIWCEGSGECRVCQLNGRTVITIQPTGGVL